MTKTSVLPRAPRALALAVLALLAPVVATPVAQASLTQESVFQDDDRLVYATPDAVAKTLDELKTLGVDRIRVSVFWRLVAPAAAEQQKPAFAASDPGAYPPGSFDRYDTIVRLAAERGIGVNLNLTSPAPSWATGSPDRTDIEETFEPNAEEFRQFTIAVGRRYDGGYSPPGQGPLPRVDHWSVWNEPNQAGWLTPQWTGEPGNEVEAAPRIYRALVGAAFDGLGTTGHGGDTILIGETAPKGLDVKGPTRAMKPGVFLRALYCLDRSLKPLQGPEAEARGCPAGPDAATVFPQQNPGLFKATGYAHHPYELTFSPSRKPRDRDFFTVANTSSLHTFLRRIYGAYAQPIPGGGRDVPLYYTEYGYQTNPPDRTGVSWARQAEYLNHAEFLTARDRSIRSHAQFLLVDSGPTPGVARTAPNAFGLTFQTGLRTEGGRAKPAYNAYRLPVFLPKATIRRGQTLRVFGLVRPATAGSAARVSVQVRGRGRGAKFRTVKRVTVTNQRHYLDTRIRVRSSGSVRLVWQDQRRRSVRSRTAAFTVRRR